MAIFDLFNRNKDTKQDIKTTTASSIFSPQGQMTNNPTNNPTGGLTFASGANMSPTTSLQPKNTPFGNTSINTNFGQTFAPQTNLPSLKGLSVNGTGQQVQQRQQQTAMVQPSVDELQKQKLLLEEQLRQAQQKNLQQAQTGTNTTNVPDVIPESKARGRGSLTEIEKKRRKAEEKARGLIAPSDEEVKLQERINALNENIAGATNLFTKQYSDLEKNPEGLFGGGLEMALKDLDKEQTMKINALTNLQSALQGNLTSLQDIRNNEYEQLKDLQTLTNPEVIGTPQINKQTGDVYAYMQDPLTGTFEVKNVGNVGVDESFDIQSIITDENTGEQFAVGTSNGQLVVKPTGVRKQPSGTSGVSTLGGQNLLSGQPAYNALNSKQKTQADSINNLVTSLKDYRDLYEQSVGLGGVEFFGEDASLLQTKLNSIIFAAAQAEGTGALQQADRDVIEQIIPNPTSVKGGVGQLFKGGTSGGLLKIDDQIAKYTGQLANYGLQPSNIDPYDNQSSQSQIPMISPDGEAVFIPSDQLEEALMQGYIVD